MKFTETNFRAVYNNFCAFELNDTLRAALNGFPFARAADHVLTYGYIDPDEGLMLEIIAAGIRSEERFNFMDSDPLIRSYIRIGQVSDVEFYYFEDEDHDLHDRYAQKLDALAPYAASGDVEKIRDMMFLDERRHSEYPDDFQVMLIKDEIDPEICWARVIGLGDDHLKALLLNEPNPAFGIHAGERITFHAEQTPDGHCVCYTNLGDTYSLSREDLADGSRLTAQITAFNTDPSDAHLLDILETLRDSLIWIPCVDDTHLIPDLLHHEDDNYFLPVFTSIEEMGSYGTCFAKIQRPFCDAIRMAGENQQRVTSIVLNAFTAPFILPKALWDVIEAMPSKLAE